MEKSPFTFGKLAYGETFINRQSEIKKLSSNFRDEINTILISPRRWGKSSLVHKVRERLSSEKNYLFCEMDMFNTRTEGEFYTLYSKQIIKSSSSKLNEWLSMTKRFLSRIIPKITVSTQDVSDIDIQFDIAHDSQSAIEILDLPEKIAKAKKCTLVVCIDEFQNIENFEDPVGFQQKIRAQWQKHRHVVYCLYGSKRHMLEQLFEKKSMPLYRFGEVIYLDKIPKPHFVEFIVKKFSKTKKKISVTFAEQLVDAVKNHPYYVQQFAHTVWNNTGTTVTKEIMTHSMDELISSNAIMYEKEYQSLSNSQERFIRALADGVEANYTSNDVIQKYNLSSSANVIIAIKGLENKEVIERLTSRIEIADPVFELWFKKRIR